MLTSTKQIFGTGSDELNSLILQQEELENQKYVRLSESWEGISYKTLNDFHKNKFSIRNEFAPNPNTPKDPITKMLLFLILMLVIMLFIGQILFN